MIKQNFIELRENALMRNADIWKKDKYMVSYAVFREMIASAAYCLLDECFIGSLHKDPNGFMEELVKEAYMFLDVPYPSPFRTNDFDFRFYYEKGVFSICAYIHNKRFYTDVRSIFLHFQPDHTGRFHKRYYLALSGEQGDLECFAVYETNSVKHVGTVSETEFNQEYATWECTHFDYITEDSE